MIWQSDSPYWLAQEVLKSKVPGASLSNAELFSGWWNGSRPCTVTGKNCTVHPYTYIHRISWIGKSPIRSSEFSSWLQSGALKTQTLCLGALSRCSSNSNSLVLWALPAEHNPVPNYPLGEAVACSEVFPDGLWPMTALSFIYFSVTQQNDLQNFSSQWSETGPAITRVLFLILPASGWMGIDFTWLLKMKTVTLCTSLLGWQIVMLVSICGKNLLQILLKAWTSGIV